MANDSTKLDLEKWGFDTLSKNARANVLSRPISAKEIHYLINRYPYLKIFDAMADFEKIPELPSPNLVRADTGWVIQDYGFYICSSPGELLYGNYAWSNEEEGEGTAGASSLTAGNGTLIKQAFDTAADMVALGKSHDWETLYVFEGTSLMNWAAWVIAEELGLKIMGYEPDVKDKEKRDRLKRGGKLDEIGIRLRLY